MTVEFFDDLEDFFAAENRARRQADNLTQDWQKKLDKGDYFMKDSGYGFPIFGKVLKRHRTKNLQNYRLCECYSVAVPSGECGDVHVSTIGKKLSEVEFELYKSKNWNL